jgi:ABC-2 type transport system ATP-binding protein
MTAAVEVARLSKTYDPTPVWMRALFRSPVSAPVVALTDVSFTVPNGGVLAIVGPNGAGKSTIFRVLTGLTTPSSGTVKVAGLDPVNDGAAVRRVVGFMPADDRTLFLRHSCYENLDFHGRLQGMPTQLRRQRIDEVLDMVGLARARDSSGFALSTGMRARLQFARAILHSPRVLILDEPTGSMDPVGAYDILQAIQEIAAASGATILISSHRVEEIEALRDNVLLLDGGEVVYWGDLETVRRQWEEPQLDLVFSSPEVARGAARLVSSLDDIELLGIDQSSVTVACSQGTGAVLNALDDLLIDVVSVTEHRASLQEFLRSIATDGQSQDSQ